MVDIFWCKSLLLYARDGGIYQLTSRINCDGVIRKGCPDFFVRMRRGGGAFGESAVIGGTGTGGFGKVFLARPAGVYDIRDALPGGLHPSCLRRSPTTLWQPFGLRAGGSSVSPWAAACPSVPGLIPRWPDAEAPRHCARLERREDASRTTLAIGRRIGPRHNPHPRQVDL